MSALEKNAGQELENPSLEERNSRFRWEPDPRFAAEIQGVYASWLSDVRTPTSDGDYPSRGIAHMAQGDQKSLNIIDGHLQAAIAARVPADRVKELARKIMKRIDELEALEQGRSRRTA